MPNQSPAETELATQTLAAEADLEDVEAGPIDHFGIGSWGQGYFAQTAAGTLAVRPTRDPHREIDLHQLVESLWDRDVRTPVIIRFSDMLRHRLDAISRAFDKAIAEEQYQNRYVGIYPIKVNQQRVVCEEIRDHARATGSYGLEAGSKAELLAVLGLTTDCPNMPIVCNGFKDAEFIEMIILAAKIGRPIIPVVERFSDLELLIEYAERHKVRPTIGVRIKPNTPGSGKWEATSGSRSKFGLFASGLVDALDLLKQHDMADCLRMVHFHVGSQVSDIRSFKANLSELASVYAELRRMGAGLDTIDIGGGLGIDYDGSQSATVSSTNYSLDEYAVDVVSRIRTACDQAGVPHPRIFSESGRAMVAFSSVLVFDVVGKGRQPRDPDVNEVRALLASEKPSPRPVADLLDAYERFTPARASDVYHDAVQARSEADTLFNLGYLSLPARALAERLYWGIGRKVLTWAQEQDEFPHELLQLSDQLVEIYFGNLSIFQSLPDSWAIDQVFPVAPIHRLNETPTHRAIIADVTCDSDGEISHFPGGARHLMLHALTGGEPYYLGVFLVGAYQEVLGDLHNLYGDSHVVHVSLDEQGGYTVDEIIDGDRVEEVLGLVQFDAQSLMRVFRLEVDRASKQGALSHAEARDLIRFYEHGLRGYTYLE